MRFEHVTKNLQALDLIVSGASKGFLVDLIAVMLYV